MRAVDARPSADEFAAAYARGEAQVVWTSLVADLETPVSAYLKLGDGRPYSFLLESVEGGAIRGRYSIIGAKPDLVWRARGERAEINRRARTGGEFEPLDEPALASLRAPDRREPDRDAGAPAAARGRPLRLHDLRHGPADGAAARREPGPARPARRGLRPPDPRGRVRQHRGPGDARHPGLPAPRPAGVARLRAGARAPGRRPRRLRPRHPPRAAARPAVADRAGRQHEPRRLPRHGRAGEGLHPGRRHLPVRAVAALRGALRPAVLRPLPRAAAPQPLALPLPPRPRRLRARGLQPRDPGPPARRQGHRSARSPAPAAAAPTGPRTRRWRRICCPTPRSWPST